MRYKMLSIPNHCPYLTPKEYRAQRNGRQIILEHKASAFSAKAINFEHFSRTKRSTIYSATFQKGGSATRLSSIRNTPPPPTRPPHAMPNGQPSVRLACSSQYAHWHNRQDGNRLAPRCTKEEREREKPISTKAFTNPISSKVSSSQGPV